MTKGFFIEMNLIEETGQSIVSECKGEGGIDFEICLDLFAVEILEDRDGGGDGKTGVLTKADAKARGEKKNCAAGVRI